MILHQHSIEKYGHVGGRFQGAVGVEGGSRPGDVVGLPFSGLAVWIGERDGLLVDAGGLAVDVGLIVVAVEDLQFVAGVPGAGGGEKDSAVAAELAGAGDGLGNFPFDVKLVVR